MDALKGMFPVEPGALEEVIEMNWRTWDADHNGTLGSYMYVRVAVLLDDRVNPPNKWWYISPYVFVCMFVCMERTSANRATHHSAMMAGPRLSLSPGHIFAEI